MSSGSRSGHGLVLVVDPRQGRQLDRETGDDAVVHLYLAELAARGYSRTTLRLRAWQLGFWARFCGGDVGASREHVVALLAGLRSLSARRSMLAGLRGFYRWGLVTGRVAADPTVGVVAPRLPRGLPRPIPDELFAAALLAADERMSAMLILARFAGLRCCEIASARSSDLSGGVLLVEGKGGHTDAVPAHPRVAGVYTRSRGWLFPSIDARGLRRSHLSAAHVSKLIGAHLAVHAPGWTAHKLRHAFGTELYRVSRDPFAVQAAMRHASLDTTRGYVALDNAAVGAAVSALDAGLGCSRSLAAPGAA